MNKKWDYKNIGEICNLINGRAFKPSDWSNEGLKIVRIQNLNDRSKPYNCFDGEVSDKHIIDDGTVLLSWSGTPGTSFGCFIWNQGKAVLNQHIFKVLVNPDIMTDDFFMFAVNSQLDEMIRQAHGGVGLRHITKKKLEAMQIPVPHLSEQRRITARIKECLDRVYKIQALREDSLKEASVLPNALYYNAVKKMQGPNMPIGELIVQSKNGRSIRSTNEKPNGNVLTLSAVHDVILNVNQYKSVKMSGEIAKKYSFKKGDVFISRSNTIDLVGLSSVAVSDSIPNMIYPDLLIKLIVDSERILPKYLAYSLRFPASRDQIRTKAKGTSQSMVKISGASLKDITIPLPPIKIQQEIIDQLDDYHQIYTSLKEELMSLPADELKQTILKKAFSGGL